MIVYLANRAAIVRPPVEKMPAVAFGGPADGEEISCDPRPDVVYFKGSGPYIRTRFVTHPGGGETVYLWQQDACWLAGYLHEEGE